MTTPWTLERGATREQSGTRFRVWAPRARTVEVKLGARRVPMVRGDGGVFEVLVADPDAPVGTDYLYVLDGERERPDPVSRHQPRGVHGPSRVCDPARFAWSDAGWRGPTLADSVLYELHVGTFTEGGTFDSAIARLPHLKSLGVTTVELMPVAENPGGRNWGYDGVQLFAPQSSCGGPEALKRLVDACHGHGLAVVLDVVYNHLGPEGNYLGEYAPYFTANYRTPWGEALNFDGPDSGEVRRFFLDNARYWVSEFHVDGLRLDAVHGIFDFSAHHILAELVEAVAALAGPLQRPVHLIAESDLNDPRLLRPPEAGGYGLDAQWSDDFHHATHTLLTGTRRGYFSDFGTVADLAKAVREHFVYDGRYSKHRRRRHGSPAVDRPGEQFVVYVQNHDQVANGSGGERLASLTSLEGQKLAAALLFCTPNVPMLFMGQEYGERRPFLYFTSHSDPDLVAAVRRGRLEEFVSFQWATEFPDPQAVETFQRSKLDWARSESTEGVTLLRFYRSLISMRASHPALRTGRPDLTQVSGSDAEGGLVLLRSAANGDPVLCVFNLRDQPGTLTLAPTTQRFRCALHSADREYGGSVSDPTRDTLERGATSIALPPLSAALFLGEAS